MQLAFREGGLHVWTQRLPGGFLHFSRAGRRLSRVRQIDRVLGSGGVDTFVRIDETDEPITEEEPTPLFGDEPQARNQQINSNRVSRIRIKLHSACSLERGSARYREQPARLAAGLFSFR